MKVFFQASILHKKDREADYQRIFDCLKENGHEVLGELMTIDSDIVKGRKKDERENYVKRFKGTILDCDVVVAEMTYPSTMHMGFKVCYALQRNKPVIVLHRKSEYPLSFFDVIGSDKLVYEEYADNNLEEILRNALDYIDKKSDSRFNFYLPSNQMDYVDRISKEEDLSRSATLRKIISETMGKG